MAKSATTINENVHRNGEAEQEFFSTETAARTETGHDSEGDARGVPEALPRCRIALETGMHSPWVSRILNELGHEVIVAHARNVRLIGESSKKDDRPGRADLGAVSQDRSAIAVSAFDTEIYRQLSLRHFGLVQMSGVCRHKM